MSARFWDEKKIETAVNTLPRHPTLASAAEELTATLGRAVNSDSLSRALRSAGKSPINLLAGRAAEVQSPAEARKMANQFTSPPAVQQAIRRGRSTIASVAANQKMTEDDVFAEVYQAAKDGYSIKDRGGVLSIAPDLDGEPYMLPALKGNVFTGLFIGDTHAGHRGFASWELTDCVEWAYEFGVRDVFVGGDLVDGNYHHGQSFELKQASLPGQIQALLNALPHLEGLTYYMISGNHDESYFRAVGAQVSQMMVIFGAAMGRKDMVHLGTTTGRVQYGEGPDAIRIMVSHSRNKKEVGRQRGQNKPDIFSQGHYHDYVVKDVHGIIYCRPGGFQRSSRFYKTLGGQPTVGGTIISMYKEDGTKTSEHTFRGYKEHEVIWK